METCSVHQGKKLKALCKSCNILICGKCIFNHGGHFFEQREDIEKKNIELSPAKTAPFEEIRSLLDSYPTFGELVSHFEKNKANGTPTTTSTTTTTSTISNSSTDSQEAKPPLEKSTTDLIKCSFSYDQALMAKIKEDIRILYNMEFFNIASNNSVSGATSGTVSPSNSLKSSATSLPTSLSDDEVPDLIEIPDTPPPKLSPTLHSVVSSLAAATAAAPIAAQANGPISPTRSIEEIYLICGSYSATATSIYTIATGQWRKGKPTKSRREYPNNAIYNAEQNLVYSPQNRGQIFFVGTEYSYYYDVASNAWNRMAKPPQKPYSSGIVGV
eukprot:gene15224-18015_t